MALAYNALIVNGVSTSSFPFLVIVEVNAAPTMAKFKHQFSDTPMANGRVKNSVDALEKVEKTYDIYLHHVNMDQVRQFKKFLGDSGWFTSADDPNIRRYYDEVEFESETLSKIDGYHVHVTFHCDPLEYEPERTINITNLTTLNNHTNANMNPRYTIEVSASNDDKWVEVNGVKMVFKVTEAGTITVETKDNQENVWYKTATRGTHLINSKTIGYFPLFKPGNNTIKKSSGITKIEILARWGWR